MFQIPNLVSGLTIKIFQYLYASNINLLLSHKNTYLSREKYFWYSLHRLPLFQRSFDRNSLRIVGLEFYGDYK